MGKDVIVACDFASAKETFAFLDRFEGKKPFVKIGMELFYAECSLFFPFGHSLRFRRILQCLR